jgi:hypothetical protein
MAKSFSPRNLGTLEIHLKGALFGYPRMPEKSKARSILICHHAILISSNLKYENGLHYLIQKGGVTNVSFIGSFNVVGCTHPYTQQCFQKLARNKGFILS